MKFLASSKLSEHRYKTPEGYLVCVDSILSRTGKQTYTRDELFKDGSNAEVEVDRLPNEVFNEKTLASFENKPLTIEHPDEDITPTNHNKYSVGFVRDIKKGTDSGQDVMLGTIVITDAEAIELVESGKLKDLSCGYDCDIEDETNPQQRNIRGNHIALCEHGRAGIARIVDSVKDTKFEICYIDNGDVCVAIEAKDENDARQKFRRRYGMYYIKHIRKVKDGVKDMKTDAADLSGLYKNDDGDAIKVTRHGFSYNVQFGEDTIFNTGWSYPRSYDSNHLQRYLRQNRLTKVSKLDYLKDSIKDMKVSHDNIREQPVFVMQSDVDKNLFFYIGETHAMKEGEYTYAQYDMEGMTPDELRKDLEANGWHKVARGPAPFIDEDPYEKSTKGLEEAEKNLHDEMICNAETDCKDEQSSELGDKVRFRNRVYVIIKVQKGKSNDVARLTLRPLERFNEKDKPFDGGGDSYWDIHIERWQLDDSCKKATTKDFVKDAKTEYIFNYQDTYHGTRDKMRVDAKNLDEAIREFGNTMALGGYGTANIYVISVSPNDGYLRAYGKLSEMLKQKWTRDSAKKLDSKKLLSIVRAAKSVKK